MDNILKLDQLFKTLDKRDLGYLEREDLQKISQSFELSDEAFEELFSELDSNGDGKVESSDFNRVFQTLMNGNERRESLTDLEPLTPLEEKPFSVDLAWKNLIYKDGNGLIFYQSHNALYDFFKQLHNGGYISLLSPFEDVLITVNSDMLQQKRECENLEESIKREKEKHSKQIEDLEEELEFQLKRMEERVKKEERSNSVNECLELKRQHKAEVADLQSNIKVLQTLESRLNKDIERTQILQLKKRIEELAHENRIMRSNLTDAQTNIIILRSDLMHSRSIYEEKCQELENEKEMTLDYLCDHDNLSKQLQQLLQANKKLQDTNDTLRSALEATNLILKRERSSRSPCGSIRSYWSQHSSIMSDLINDNGSISSTQSITSGRSRISNASPPVSDTSQDSRGFPDLQINNTSGYFVKVSESNNTNSPDDVDSGFSTIMDLAEPETDIDEPSFTDDRMVTSSPATVENENFRPKFPEDSCVELSKIIKTEPKYPDRHQQQGSSSCYFNYLLPHSKNPQRELKTEHSNNQKSLGSPERMYKIVLAGDAAVGKSSFILRLCKGKFVPFLSSTLGVDFQVKTMDLDGKTVALQLWDTAGQERFRSIAKSYFRRADGVLLLYDCTHEPSFLNVRQWMNSILDAGTNEIPIMICANKVDLREKMKKEGQMGRIVSTEDGRRIAKENSALFYEISAKDGTNINEAIIDLARLLSANEDFCVKTGGLQLTDSPTPIKKNKCCFS